MVLVAVLRPVALKFVQLLETTDLKPRHHLHSSAVAEHHTLALTQKLNANSVYEIDKMEICNEYLDEMCKLVNLLL